MGSTSYWLTSKKTKRFAAIDQTVTVDVLVVGGGITGLTTAYLLRRNGLSVAVAERGRFGHVDTGHTTAHLTAVTDTRLHKLVQDFGRDHAEAVWDAGTAAVAQIEENVRRENIDCEFTRIPGYLHLPVDGKSD